MDIDKPIILPKSAIMASGPEVAIPAWKQRDLSGLQPEISEHAVPFFPLEVQDTPEFLKACIAYEKHHRCIDAKYEFLDHEQFLLQETCIQYGMRKNDCSRTTAEGWLELRESHNPQIVESKKRLKEQRQADEFWQVTQPHRKCDSCLENDRLAAERAEILARDPWLAEENDEKDGEGSWEPAEGFGSGDLRSAELRRRDEMITRAWKGMFRYEAAAMERDKFITPFRGDSWYAMKY
jgi:hypothetical protein